MKKNNKSLLTGVALCGVFVSCDAFASTSIYPISRAMVDTIKNAPDAAAARTALCGSKSVIRGSGISAGNNCKLQDFARVAVVACSGYASGGDSFASSKCAKNAAAVSITDAQKAADALSLAVKADVSYTTNAKFLICGPESLGDQTASYRAKLPSGLKAIADKSCPKTAAPGRPASLNPADKMGQTNPPARPSTAAPRTAALKQEHPPIEMNINVQGALRDLKDGRRASVSDLFQGQNHLLDALAGLEKKEQALVGAEKVGPKSGALQSQQAAIISEYEKVNTALGQIKIELETSKDLKPALLDQAQKLSVEIKKLTQAASAA